MAGTGPPPNPNRRRRNAGPAMIKLPADGREGDIPPWPLPKGRSAPRNRREAEVWAELWRTPQSVMWERLAWTRTVARYVRFLVQVEAGDTRIASEVRQMEDRLGLNPLALLRLRWVVEDQPAGEVRDFPKAVGSEERRLRAVDPEE